MTHRVRQASLACAIVLSFAAVFAQAEDKPKSVPLTAKEVDDGWLLLFDGETTFGFKTEGGAKVKNGTLIVGGVRDSKVTTTTAFGRGLLRCKFEQTGPLKAEIQWRGESQHLGNSATLEWEPAATGMSPIAITVPAGTELEIRQLAFHPGAMTSLFNGKDLTGWSPYDKEPARQKSKFIVTREGWLNVTNGPGDLRTDGQYDDFVLQLQCMSNGKALNSGVFFRCIAGQYQNGYEAQIHNGFKDGDRTKPSDFGTGAIYRRVPARKVVPNDNEWFTMTVMAQGKHFATWVNGYQTVDWIDERKSNDNPRQGFRAEKGHISIQGHDATTNLSFRNIRIAELPKQM